MPITAIKITHTVTWLSIEWCMAYLLYSGFARRSGRRVAIAAAVVGTECLVFVGNGFHCPLTQLAQRLGAGRASVTDIYLPERLARTLPAAHVPFLILAALLHARNVRARGVAGAESVLS